MTVRVYTIGHSTRLLEEFIAILQAFNIRMVADVRTIPRSRRNPQYNQDTFAHSLAQVGIGYAHLQKLGGLRHTRAQSINTAWENPSFRGYADHMQTPEFAQGMAVLLSLAEEQPTAVMCAEAVPWRCHRSLIGDALLVRGIEVVDILSLTSSRPHTLIPWAHVENEQVTYPGPVDSSDN